MMSGYCRLKFEMPWPGRVTWKANATSDRNCRQFLVGCAKSGRVLPYYLGVDRSLRVDESLRGIFRWLISLIITIYFLALRGFFRSKFLQYRVPKVMKSFLLATSTLLIVAGLLIMSVPVKAQLDLRVDLSVVQSTL